MASRPAAPLCRAGLQPDLSLIGAAAACMTSPIWRQGKASISAFGMAEFVDKDRNPVSFYADSGIAFKGFLPQCPEDILSFGVDYFRISPGAIAGDRNSAVMSGLPQPIRDAETVFEVSYGATIALWWTIQPDLQYFVHPGGNVPLPGVPDQPIPNTPLLGLRTQIKF